MSRSNEEAQLVRGAQSGPGCLKRMVRLLFLAILAVGMFAVGYATGTGVEILAPANALIETAIAAMPDYINTLSARSPQSTFTPPSTPTPNLPSCYPHSQAWVTGTMNVRERPSANAQKVGAAHAGESFSVLESRPGDTYCWLRINKGWMAKTALVSATKPQARSQLSGQRRPPSAGHLECPCRRAREPLLALRLGRLPLLAICRAANCSENGRADLRALHRRHFQQHQRNRHRAYCGQIRSPRQRPVQRQRPNAQNLLQ